MANRVLRDWTDSDKVNELSVYAERFFTRLIMKVDDFGCYPANVKLLKSTLFPLIDGLTNDQVDGWLTECYVNGLVILYEVKEKKYLQIVDFKQRLRQARGKYPLPTDGQLSVNGRPETKRNESETETESETESEPLDVACDLKELDDELVKIAADLTEGICEYFDVKTVVTSKLYNNVCDFVSTLGHRNELQLCSMALQKYMTYKARSQEQKHSVLTWMGTKQAYYRDGHWFMTDWANKDKNYVGNGRSNGISKVKLDEFDSV